MDENNNKILILSLLAYTIGGFLFAAGLTTRTTISIIVFYLTSLFLYLSGILCLYNNYKKYQGPVLYLYLAILGGIFIVYITAVLIASM